MEGDSKAAWLSCLSHIDHRCPAARIHMCQLRRHLLLHRLVVGQHARRGLRDRIISTSVPKPDPASAAQPHLIRGRSAMLRANARPPC